MRLEGFMIAMKLRNCDHNLSGGRYSLCQGLAKNANINMVVRLIGVRPPRAILLIEF